jgi:hypothetical protein
VAIKILTVMFALFGLRRAMVRWRRGSGLLFEFVFWALVWSGVAIVVFVPHYTDRIGLWMGVSSGFNALVFIAILGLLVAVYRLLVRTQTLQRDLTQLIRAQALSAPEQIQPRRD